MRASKFCVVLALLLTISSNMAIAQQSGCNVSIASTIVQRTYGGQVVGSYLEPNSRRYIVTIRFPDGRTGVFYLDQNCLLL